MKQFVVAALLLALFVADSGATEPTVESFVLDDTTYGLQRPVWLYRSEGATGSGKQPHTLFLFLEREYVEELAVPAVLQKLVASGEIPPAIAVVLDTSTERPAEIANRAKFDRMITADLLPWLRAKLGGLPEPANVVIAGFSVGSLNAAYVAHRHPDVFGNVLAQSGAFWRGNEGANDPPEWLTSELRSKPRLPLRFYVEVGSEETRETRRGPGGRSTCGLQSW